MGAGVTGKDGTNTLVASPGGGGGGGAGAGWDNHPGGIPRGGGDGTNNLVQPH